ncbi:androgen-induced gene 1 protein-like isoform X3 [Osmia bicornis bicornis]|uniref:androgen-induced gene 1 protein-like isoform X3 n=1 Tax=Osmia bicornis bicornis TaxID=1437191 RepID=UPI0010F94E22|nr:androgen-induced gene 1 protein-like isoform X3 [Osmia bicornis bicornis]XP_029033030.1 androgen-induced gene 1 protein-like isoform X3 [Osmia bicornis bicornis]
MAWTINQLFHAKAFLVSAYTVYKTYLLVIPVVTNQYKNFDVGQWRYLTFWNLIIQAVFFFICVLNDWFGTNTVSPKKPPFIRKLKDYVHAAFAFPTAMFVATIFWSLYAIDRELVFPKALDPYFPWWLNHLMHTTIVASILIEIIVAPRKYPKRLKGILGIQALMVSYLIWMLIIFSKSGVWVYPIFHVLNLPTRTLFCITMLAYSTVLYVIGESLDNFIWGNEYIKHQKSHAKSK